VYPDFDASPTKAWMIYNRAKDDVKPLFELAFGKRAYEELYDLESDPDYMKNLAGDENYAGIKRELNARLISELEKYNDPRIMETPCRFEHQPYAGELQDFQK
jgi:hypothetical protein